MKNNKLLDLLCTFSKYELNRLQKWLVSPTANEQEVLCRLFAILDEAIRAEEELKKEAIWLSLHPDRAYNDRKLRRYFSDLYKLTCRFLAFETYLENGLTEQLYILRSLNDRKLEKHFRSAERRARQLLEQYPSRNTTFLHQHYVLERERAAFLSRRIKRSTDTHLEESGHRLDLFYLATKLRDYCTALAHTKVLKTDIQLDLIPFLKKAILSDERYLQQPLIAIYYQILQTLLEEEEDTHFERLQRQLKEYEEQFSHRDLREFYQQASNYCIRRANHGELIYFRRLFELYQQQLESEILFEEQLLNPWDFKNIITVGIFIEEYDWTEEFMQTYSSRLPEDFKETAIHYNWAKLHFARTRYEKVIELLREVEYQDISYALGARWLLIRTYYELDEYDALDALLESFRVYLHRNKLIARTTQRQYLNNIRFVQRLIRLRIHDKEAIRKFKEQLENTSDVFGKHWILSKAPD